MSSATGRKRNSRVYARVRVRGRVQPKQPGGGGPRCRLDFMQNENQLRVLTMRVRAIRRLLKQPAAILPFLERK